MKKTLGKKVEMGMKLVPIPLSLLLAGTMAVTVQADEVNNETEGNQVQNNQATPPVNQENCKMMGQSKIHQIRLRDLLV